MAGSTWKGANARRCVASEARPPREDMSPRATASLPPDPPSDQTSAALGLACRMPASWRGACKRRGQERAGAGVFIAGLQAPCQRSRHDDAQRDVIFNEPARRIEGGGGHRLTGGLPVGHRQMGGFKI